MPACTTPLVQRVARTGVTVAAVIHQPSYETFSMFDDVILLAKGGKTAYYGPVAEVKAHFEGLGFSVPPHMNPPDYYMDIVSGLVTLPSGRKVDAAVEWAVKIGARGTVVGELANGELVKVQEDEEEGLGQGFAVADGSVSERLLLRAASGGISEGLTTVVEEEEEQEEAEVGRCRGGWRRTCQGAVRLRKTLGVV